jgi:hypothetical protein
MVSETTLLALALLAAVRTIDRLTRGKRQK